MIYRITFLSDEEDKFRRVYEIDSEATFLDLHKIILSSVGYPDDQMTSFFLCNERWEKEQEVTLVEMPSSFEYDNLVMEETELGDLLTETHQKLLYVFDPMFERCFFGELTAMEPGSLKEPICKKSEGKAPKQLQTEAKTTTQTKDIDVDEDFYGDSQYDDEEIDPEGFGDMNFDDSSLF